MIYAIRFLRAELNRERSWENGYFKDLVKNRKMNPKRSLEMRKRTQQERILSIQMALTALKLVKKTQHYERPQYYWLNPKVGQPKRLDIST